MILLIPAKFWSKLFCFGLVMAAVIFVTGLRAESPWAVRDSGVTANLWSAAVGVDQVVAVGEQGTILTSRDEGLTWVRRESGTTVWLTSVTYDATSKFFFAVGESGAILSSVDGLAWRREISPTTVRFNNVWSINSVVSAIGESGAGLVVRDSSGIWTRNDVGFGDRWLRGRTETLAVGQGGSVLQSSAGGASGNNATAWLPVSSSTNSDLEAAVLGPSGQPGFLAPDSLVTIVGANGAILQRDQTSFVIRNSGTTQRLRGICYKAGSALTLITNDVRLTIGEYFSVGTSGIILRSTAGITWQPDESPTARNLNAVITTTKTVIALGDGGTILQTGGGDSAPSITHQPVVGLDAESHVYLEGGATGPGALTYLWVQLSGGAPVPVGFDYPRQLIPDHPTAPTAAVPPVYQLYVGNAFGLVHSETFVPHRFYNLSSRAWVGTGEQKLISGFTVASILPTLPRTILVRAVGPTLGNFGVANSLKAPRLTVFSGNKIIATNTGWQSNADVAGVVNATQRAGAFPLPNGSSDSVLLLSLAAGSYTAQVESADGNTGVALVEVYDPDAPTLTRLNNLSARAQVQAGDNVLIGGLVISGGVKKNVLLRAAGPSLTAFEVSGVLSKPKLTLFRGSTVIATATSWSSAPNADDLRAAAKNAGAFAFPEGSADAALLAQLDPGAYTLLVTGADGGGGVALVEVYEQP